MMKHFYIFAVLLMLFLSACETTKQEKYKYSNSCVPQSEKNRSSWEKIRNRYEEKQRNSRPTRGDVNSFRNDQLEVFPGRTGRRSQEVYENSKSVFSIW